MARPQQGMQQQQQPSMRQGMMQPQGVMAQNNVRPMMAVGGAGGGVGPQQMNQQQQPRPFGGGGAGYNANQMQMQQQMLQVPRGNMSGGQFGQAGGAMTPQQQVRCAEVVREMLGACITSCVSSDILIVSLSPP